MATTPTATLFLSYAGDDRRIAEHLWTNLRTALSTSRKITWKLWAFGDQLILGDDWHRAIQKAIDESSLGLFAISNSFLCSEYIREHELARFIQSNVRKWVAPIMLRPLPATADLRGLESLEFFAFHEPYSECRGPGEREKWANRLADDLHRVVDRYELGR